MSCCLPKQSLTTANPQRGVGTRIVVTVSARCTVFHVEHCCASLRTDLDRDHVRLGAWMDSYGRVVRSGFGVSSGGCQGLHRVRLPAVTVAVARAALTNVAVGLPVRETAAE